MRIRGHQWRLIVEGTNRWMWGAEQQVHGCYALYLGRVVAYFYTRWEEVQAWLDEV